MKKTIKLVLFLGVVAAVSGLCISFVNGITSPIIEANSISSEKTNLELMFPGGTFTAVEYTGDDENVLGIYEVSDTGYVIKVQGYGYSSTPIVALIGMDYDAAIIDVVVLSNQETNGFGSRCFESDFIQEAYVGKTADQEVGMISGATKTSTAMKNMIDSARNALNK